MGRGDKKTKKGKLSMGSYGVLRPRESNKPKKVATKSTKKTTVKKEKAEPVAVKGKSTAKKSVAKTK